MSFLERSEAIHGPPEALYLSRRLSIWSGVSLCGSH